MSEKSNHPAPDKETKVETKVETNVSERLHGVDQKSAAPDNGLHTGKTTSGGLHENAKDKPTASNGLHENAKDKQTTSGGLHETAKGKKDHHDDVADEDDDPLDSKGDHHILSGDLHDSPEVTDITYTGLGGVPNHTPGGNPGGERTMPNETAGGNPASNHSFAGQNNAENEFDDPLSDKKTQRPEAKKADAKKPDAKKEDKKPSHK
jgi:hypothetical protein